MWSSKQYEQREKRGGGGGGGGGGVGGVFEGGGGGGERGWAGGGGGQGGGGGGGSVMRIGLRSSGCPVWERSISSKRFWDNGNADREFRANLSGGFDRKERRAGRSCRAKVMGQAKL